MNDDICHDSSAEQQQQVNQSIGDRHQRPVMDLDDELQVAKQGIVLWLNNEPIKAESFLRQRIDSSVHVMTSYTFINCIVSGRRPAPKITNTVHLFNSSTYYTLSHLVTLP